MTANNDFNRSLSRIFTNPVFKQIAQSGSSDYFLSKLKKYDSLLSIEPGMQVKNIIENAYGYLGKNYRNEYVYKNTILNNILLGRHSLRTATMLNEFKVCNSIADTVIINGTSTVYEIKTELDSPDKLEKQIQDYKKAFAKIYLVTHHSLTHKYLSLIQGSTLGLLSLSGRFNLTVVKEAIEDYTCLCNDTMMKTLRKEEYTFIIRKYTGSVPNVSNIRFFSECILIARKIESEVLHQLMLEQLCKRIPAESDFLESESLPRELKHICLCINPNKKEYNNLFHFLTLNL
ncbi:MAG: sce7726 family protein [Chitinophagaceae bacterium]